MKFEKLNDNKIRIVLSSNDMSSNNISTDNVFSDNSISEKFLQDILYKAEKEIDFKTDDSKLLVEILKSFEGGLVFNITKFKEYNDIYVCLNLMFKFNSFEDFLCLCTYLKNMSFFDFEQYSSQFSLALYNNTYYLSISDYCQLPLNLLNALSEFGNLIDFSAKLDGLINEYGKILFEKNAIYEGMKMI